MKKNRPTVSVIMPAYNAARFISESIESILSQTYKDFELIIINDCSTDDTEKIILDYKKKDDRIIYVKNDTNLGVGQTRNKGISMARGDYIVWQDADDTSLPDRVKYQINFLKEHPKTGVVGGTIEFFGENITKSIRKYAKNDQALRAKIFRYNPIANPASTYKKEVFSSVGNFNPLLRVSEDLDMLLRTGTKYQFGNVPELVLHYRQDNASLTRSKLREMELTAIKLRFKYMNDKAYNANAFDYIYNIAQFLSIFIVPAKLKIAVFNLIRNSKV